MSFRQGWEASYRKNRLKWRGTTNFNPGLPSGSRVLEAGCGNGKNLSSLLGKGLGLYGIDYSLEAVKQTKGMAKSRGEKAVLSVQDLSSTNFKAGFFDAVVCFHVLGHMLQEERERAIGEVKRILKKGGLLFFREFSTKDFRFGKGIEHEKNSFLRKAILTHYFTEKEVKGLFPGFTQKSFKKEEWTVHWEGKNLGREEFDCVFEK